MDKKVLIATFLFLTVAVWGTLTLSRAGKNIQKEVSGSSVETKVPEESGGIVTAGSENLILFYSDTCPHCKIVEKYISDNNVLAKVALSQKEVSGNRENSNELVAKAKECGIEAGSIGVPFLWNNGQCLVGDKEITDFLSKKITGK